MKFNARGFAKDLAVFAGDYAASFTTSLAISSVIDNAVPEMTKYQRIVTKVGTVMIGTTVGMAAGKYVDNTIEGVYNLVDFIKESTKKA